LKQQIISFSRLRPTNATIARLDGEVLFTDLRNPGRDGMGEPNYRALVRSVGRSVDGASVAEAARGLTSLISIAGRPHMARGDEFSADGSRA